MPTDPPKPPRPKLVALPPRAAPPRATEHVTEITMPVAFFDRPRGVLDCPACGATLVLKRATAPAAPSVARCPRCGASLTVELIPPAE